LSDVRPNQEIEMDRRFGFALLQRTFKVSLAAVVALWISSAAFSQSNLSEIAGSAVVEGKPLANVAVRLRNVDNGVLVGDALTNAAGALRFTGLPVGNYIVETVAPNGTLLGTSTRIALVAGGMVATGVTVTTSAAAAAAFGVGAAGAGAAAAGGAFLATTAGIAATPGDSTEVASIEKPGGIANLGEIAGSAVVEGKPVANAAVRLRNVDNGVLVGDALTNAAGAFRFTGLPVGNYVVETVAPNGTILGTSERMTPTAGSASASRDIVTVVALGAGVSRAAGAGADAGTAVVEGKSLPGMSVRLRNVDNGALVGNGSTNNGGEFRFTGLSPGNFVVETVAPNGTMLGTSTRIVLPAATTGASGSEGVISGEVQPSRVEGLPMTITVQAGLPGPNTKPGLFSIGDFGGANAMTRGPGLMPGFPGPGMPGVGVPVIRPTFQIPAMGGGASGAGGRPGGR
jgi:hypothetical protein